MTANQLFRALPSVDVLLKALARHSGNPDQEGGEISPLFQLEDFVLPRALLRDLVNAYLDECRKGIRSGKIQSADELGLDGVMPGLLRFLRDKSRPHFRRVVNATGVVIHTNLGRSRLAEEAAQAVAEACAHYSNLEFNLETGERGSRYSHVEELLCSLTGAEAALVVNNNAAAVLIVLDTFCKGREAIVSRGELVEIGGSFRIPEVMEKSGCTLREVGATNRAHPRDYINAINENTAALMRVHTSNYRVIGFHSEVPLNEMQEIARAHKLPLLVDLGSGSLCDFAAAGLPVLAQDEPRVQKIVADGADVVTFSGDKVLGGPQAGIIVGRREYIDQIKKNPLNRALRIDKMTLAALEATLRLYTEPELAIRRIPTLRLICAGQDELRKKAQKLARMLRSKLSGMQAGKNDKGDAAAKVGVSVREGMSLIGGGSFPERHIPTTLVAVESANVSAKDLRERLLSTTQPVVARIEDDKLCLDVRTLEDDELKLAVDALVEALGRAS